jgi:hypothetical protein
LLRRGLMKKLRENTKDLSKTINSFNEGVLCQPKR